MAGLIALGAAYVLSQFFRVALAVLAPVLTADLGMDARQLAWASAAWFLGFAALQLPLGLALDRLGPRRTAGWLTAVAGGGGAALFALARGPGEVIAAMALIGAGCAPALMAALYLFARSYPPARFAVLGSTLLGVGTLGNAGAAAPLVLAVEAMGWRAVLGATGVLAALTGAALLAFLRDPPPAPRAADDRGLRDVLRLAADRRLWPIYLMMAVNYAPAVGIRGLWAGPWLAQVHGLSAGQVGLATLAMALAMAAGAFAVGPLERRLGSAKWLAAGGTAGVALACAALAALPGGAAAPAVALIVVVGFLGAGYVAVMAHARPFFPPALTGRGVTLMNFFSMAGVGAFQAAGGALVAGAATPGAGFAAIFVLYAGAAAAATAVYAFSPERRD